MTRTCVFPATATLTERFSSETPATHLVPAWLKGVSRSQASATVRHTSEDGSATIVHQATGTLPLRILTDASSAHATSMGRCSRRMEAVTRILATVHASLTSKDVSVTSFVRKASTKTPKRSSIIQTHAFPATAALMERFLLETGATHPVPARQKMGRSMVSATVSLTSKDVSATNDTLKLSVCIKSIKSN